MNIITRHAREIDSLFNSVTRSSTCRQQLGELQASGSLCSTTARHHTIRRIVQRKKLQFLHLILDDEMFSPLHKNRAKNVLLLKLFVKMNKYKIKLCV